MNELLFIDTNVVMDARGKEHPYRASCGRIILEIATGSFQENLRLTDTEVLQEIPYQYALIGKWETGISVAGIYSPWGWISFLSGLERYCS
ncbi:hypothetical protein M1O20_07195 [Dehalococcoidia bacterium]|nr:hypothetical protein [Dehalococcoidia bacterium]